MERAVTPQRVPPIPPRDDLDAIPPYVPGRHPAEIEREYGIADVAKLASNESPLGPSPRAVDAIRAAAREGHVYPDARVVALREALAERHGVDVANVVVGNGSVECIDLVARAFLRPDDVAVVGFPSFPRYLIACRLGGVDPAVVTHREWTFDLGGILDAITDRTRVVFLDDPCNPTGTHVGAEALGRFLDAVPDQVLVVLDRAYYEFVPPDDRLDDDLDRIMDGANLVVLRTFSKAYGLAGLRVGYALARREHARAMWRVREAFAVNAIGQAAALAALGYALARREHARAMWRVREAFAVNAIGQAAALAALGDADHVRRTVELVGRERERLARAFTRLGVPYVPSVSTNFLFADLGPDAERVNEALLSRGVVIRPMTAPGISTRARITVGPPRWNDRLIGALEEVLA